MTIKRMPGRLVTWFAKEWAMYLLNVLQLWVTRKITFQTVLHALECRPIAVAGRGGSYIVDPDFQ